MISVLKPLEAEGYAPQLEELLSVACEAYEEKTGLDNDYYYDKYDQFDPVWYDEQDLDLDWDEDDEDGLQMRFLCFGAAIGTIISNIKEEMKTFKQIFISSFYFDRVRDGAAEDSFVFCLAYCS
ncbi:hypothetical protein AAAC51_35785 [Priestia megaterium]